MFSTTLSSSRSEQSKTKLVEPTKPAKSSILAFAILSEEEKVDHRGMKRQLQVQTELPTSSSQASSPSRRPTVSPIELPTRKSTSPSTVDANRSSNPSDIPSFFPSQIPSDKPSSPSLPPDYGLPSAPRPSDYPSIAPTVEPIPVHRNSIQMVLNMPRLDNASISYWQIVTSNHVLSYWNARNNSPIAITQVMTQLLYQDFYEYSDASELSVHYQQNITFGYVFPSDYVEDNNDVIFLDPFDRSEAGYIDDLAPILNLDVEIDTIRIRKIVVLDNTPPTLSPSAGTAPAAGFVSNSDGSLGVGAIAVISTVIFLVLTGGLIGYLYLRKRQHEHDMAWASDYARPMDQRDYDFSPEMEDYPTVAPSGRSSPREMPVVDEGDEENQDDDSDVEDIGDQYSAGPLETYLNALPVDDDEDDPTSPYTQDSRANTLSMEGAMDDSMEDVRNEGEMQPISPPQPTSSSDSSMHEPPSLWAFQVKVTELDD